MKKLLKYAGVALVLIGLAAVLWLDARFRTLESPHRHDPRELAELVVFPYGDWGAVLARRVDAEGRVDYTGLRADRQALDSFVALVAEVGPLTRSALFPDRESRLAYYLNAYNALVLFGVLEHRPLESIAEHKLDFFYFTSFRLDGERTNLYDLEHEGIRGRFAEPRVHFALNCASLGCPRLPTEPFLPGRLEEQLERETRRFLHESRNVAVEDGELVLSELFDWFAGDFGGDPAAWIAQRAPDLDLPPGLPLRHRPWDWSLNVQPAD